MILRAQDTLHLVLAEGKAPPSTQNAAAEMAEFRFLRWQADADTLAVQRWPIGLRTNLAAPTASPRMRGRFKNKGGTVAEVAKNDRIAAIRVLRTTKNPNSGNERQPIPSQLLTFNKPASDFGNWVERLGPKT